MKLMDIVLSEMLLGSAVLMLLAVGSVVGSQVD